MRINGVFILVLLLTVNAYNIHLIIDNVVQNITNNCYGNIQCVWCDIQNTTVIFCND